MSLVFYCLQELDWDTTFFGVKMGEIQLDLKNDGSDFSESALRRTIEVARKQNYHFLLCQLDTHQQEISHVLTNHSAILGDVLVTLALDLTKYTPPVSVPKYEIIKATPKDLKEITLIAANSFSEYSRFYQDTHFDPDRVREFYPCWVSESFASDGNTHIIKEQEKILGFISLQLKSKEKMLVITLIAIEAAKRGKGLGQALIEWVIGYAADHGFTRIQVGTQINNLPAIRLYEKNGFQLISSKYRFHIWLGPVSKVQKVSKNYNETALLGIYGKNS